MASPPVPITSEDRAGPSSDMSAFRQILARAKNIVVLSGAGISAESGVPTFRGAGGYWRKYDATQLATPEAFMANPSLVWEFYSHRREVASSKVPNAGHKAVAELEQRLSEQGRKVTVVTQNIDRLHHKAGSKNIIEMHGTLFKTRCTRCGNVTENHDIPIVPSLEGKGAPDPHVEDASIPVSELPKFHFQGKCGTTLPEALAPHPSEQASSN